MGASASPGALTGPSQLAYHDSDSHVRAEHLSIDEIRSGGALFNAFSGAKIDVIELPMVFVLWPGYGPRSTGFHFANAEEGLTTAVHTHPASDEAVWGGFAAPPQLDLYARTPYYLGTGTFAQVPFGAPRRLTAPALTPDARPPTSTDAHRP
jgi:hypothetical protein